MKNKLHDDGLKNDTFIDKIKTDLTDKNKKLESIKDMWNKNPKPLHEIVNIVPIPNGIRWRIDDNYKINESLELKITEIFNSVFKSD